MYIMYNDFKNFFSLQQTFTITIMDDDESINFDDETIIVSLVGCINSSLQ